MMQGKEVNSFSFSETIFIYEKPAFIALAFGSISKNDNHIIMYLFWMVYIAYVYLHSEKETKRRERRRSLPLF
jgi:hypothetical protein